MRFLDVTHSGKECGSWRTAAVTVRLRKQKWSEVAELLSVTLRELAERMNEVVCVSLCM